MLSSDRRSRCSDWHDAYDAHARKKIKALNPDVLTLDVEMPRMDGLTFLRNLIACGHARHYGLVVDRRGAEVTLDALSVGAVDYLSKPKIDLGRHARRLQGRAHRQGKGRCIGPGAGASGGWCGKRDARPAKRAPKRQLRTTEASSRSAHRPAVRSDQGRLIICRPTHPAS